MSHSPEPAHSSPSVVSGPAVHPHEPHPNSPDGQEPTGRLVAESLVFVLVSAMAGVAVAYPLARTWVALASPPRLMVSGGGVSYGESEMNALTGIPGWFVVIGMVAGLAGGALLAWFGRRYGQLVVVAALLFSVTAAVLTRAIGIHWLSAPSLRDQLDTAANGDTVQMPVQLGSRSLLLAWPVGALAGVVAVVALLWPRKEPDVP